MAAIKALKKKSRHDENNRVYQLKSFRINGTNFGLGRGDWSNSPLFCEKDYDWQGMGVPADLGRCGFDGAVFK